MTAYRKLDLYISLLDSAVKVCRYHYLESYENKVQFNFQGISGNHNTLKCNICNDDLIEYDKFLKMKEN